MDIFDSRADRGNGPFVEEGVDPSPARIEDLYGTCEPIAVIGLACRFPGAPDSEAYWRNLVDGVESGRRLSDEELRASGVAPETARDPRYVNVAAVLDDVEAFDAELFGYSRQEAEVLDPQQRLFLQIVWHTLEHAGYAPRHVPHKTGVFGAARISSYPGRERIALGVSSASGLQALLGNDKDYLATRVAYKLNLKGPALAIQTACSSSLVTVHMACESLRSGECDMAIAGGAAVSFPHTVGYLHQPGMIFSPDGKCRPFDAEAQGTYGGHGVGAVALRRLDDALRDGDPVLAVLRGSAINNDGSLKVGFTAPSVAGQRDVIREAMLVADVGPDDIGMIEAHGTATSLGDPIEIEALAAAMSGRDAAAPPVWIGSVKGNFGHLDTAAGIASLIKAVLAANHGEIPPSLGFTRPNPALKLEQTPFAIAVRRQAWTGPVRTAGVSAFGLGGTNCHVVVQSAPPRRRAEVKPRGASGLCLSAATREALRRLAGTYAASWREGVDPSALAETALHGREVDLGHRLAVPICDDAPAALEAFAAGIDDPLVFAGQGKGRALWLFSGQGTQWEGMGEALHRRSDAFARSLDACCNIVAPHLELPLRDVMWGRHPGALADIRYAQPAIVAFQIAMAAFWRDLGLAPAAVLGHSVGEYAAAVVAGIVPVETVLPLVVERGRLMQVHGAGGAMLAVFADEATLRPLLAHNHLDIASYNDECHLVLSGRAADITAAANELDARGVRHNSLAVAGAAHSAMLDAMLDPFAEAAACVENGKQPAVTGILYLSGLLGRAADAAELRTRNYWRRHVREPVRYGEALRCALADEAIFGLEIGADGPLVGIGRRAHPQCHWIVSARPRQPAEDVLQTAYLQLYAAGVDLPRDRLWPARGLRCHAPLYPFASDLYACEPLATPAKTLSPPVVVSSNALDAGRKVATIAAKTLDLSRLQKLYACIVPLHAIYVDAMVRDSVGDRIDAGVRAIDILRSGRLLPRYWQLLSRLLKACVEDGYYRCDGDLFATARTVPHEARDRLIDELHGYCEDLDAIPDTVARAGAQLGAMMRGDVDPVGVIFPSSASQGVEVLYQDFSFGRYFNQIAAGVVAGLMRDRRGADCGFDVLEVGGGTGGTTAWLLPEMRGRPNVRYDFTDISPIFTRRAAEKFASYDFLDYRELDLQRDAQEQGFALGSYDLIVAANVVHATQHLGHTLRLLRSLLKPGGRLMMREITQPMRLFDFVFGPLVAPLLDQPERGGELFLDTARWETACRDAGFATVAWLPEDGTATSRMSEHIILAGTTEAVVAAGLGRIGVDSGTHVLGQIIGDGVFLADWSDCTDDDAWRLRLADAASALALRHGARMPVWPAVVRRPPCLSDMRLTWRPGLFGDARIDLEVSGRCGDWQLIARAKPASVDAVVSTSPLPVAAPATSYRWHWRTAGTSSVSLTWRAHGANPDMLRDWRAAGIRLDDDATARIVVPFGKTVAELAASVLAHVNSTVSEPLVVITRDAWAQNEGSETDPAQRAIWGLLRVAAVEHLDARIGIIDLPADSDGSDLARGLAAIEAGERWVAMRDGTAHALELVSDATTQPPMPPDSLRGARWHVVTGGFGGLGRAGAAWLIEQGAERVAILAHRASGASIAWQTDLEKATGGKVRWLTCDVADPDALRDVLEKLEADGGIAGVLHAAGTLDDAPLAELDKTRLDKVLAVKAGAADVLAAHLGGAGRGRYLVLYSSAAAALGAPGQGAHALASAYLDGRAERERARGLAAVSIAWGAWGETGRAATPELQRRLADEGMGVLATGEGLWHIEQAMLGAPAYRLAMRIDATRIDPRRKLFAETPRSPSVTLIAAPRTSTKAAPQQLPSLTGDATTDTPALEDWLSRRVASQLRLDAAVVLDPNRDLLQLGLDSLLFLELSSDVERALGVRLDAARAYQAMSIAGLAALILSDHQRSSASSSTILERPQQAAANPAARYGPFPLTPIQHAYWLGRTNLLEFGGIACHVVFEWDKTIEDCDPDALERAWNAVVARHDMLRVTIGDDGQQCAAADRPAYRFTRADLRGLSAAEADTRLAAVRERLSREVTPADRWPLFEVAISRKDDVSYRLHMKLDLLLFDVQSFKVLFDDLATAFAGEALPPLGFTFRDYVMHRLAERERPAWRAAWRYWLDQIETLPPAPDLALAEADGARQPRVVTRQGRLGEAEWSRLKARWRDWGVTPSAALLTLFALVLERASRRPDFTLNLTFFNRQPVHPDVSQLIGDFTSVLLVEFGSASGEGLRAQMQTTQARLWGHLANSVVNGVDVLRALGRRHGVAGRPLMPVVFTSMLGMTLDGLSIDRAMTRLLGDPVHVFTQTPQVWIDHQAMEEDGGLLFHWYCMDEVLAPNLAATLFEDYGKLLQALASAPEEVCLPSVLPPRRPHPAAGDPGLDWRDLEAALRAYPGVDAALVEAHGSQRPIAWLSVDPNHESGSPRAIALDTSRLPVLDAAQQAEIETVWRHMQTRALCAMWATLQRHRLFLAAGERATQHEVCARIGASAASRRLLKQWLDHFDTHGLLRRDGNVYVRTDVESPAAAPDLGSARSEWVGALERFADCCIEAHDTLLRGERSALEIFFDADLGGEQVLYRAHPVPSCLNRAAAEVARKVAEGRAGLKVLDVGAGTGATAEAVIPAIRDALASYAFTDVSTLFLDDAKRLFADEPALRTALFDVNAAVDFSAHPSGGYDIVLAVNVLHDAKHVVRSLRRLRHLLKADGVLLVIEATERDSSFQLATVGFIEGLNGYEDFRTEDDKPMLDAAQWRGVLQESGFLLGQVWPEEGHGNWRQSLFVATPKAGTCPSVAGLGEHLREHWHGLLPDLAYRLCERLPHTNIRPPAEQEVPRPAIPLRERRPEVERIVADVWSNLLSRPIDATIDFFASGGDSLFATRMIATLNGDGFPQASLRQVFEHPRFADFCVAIASAAPGQNERLQTLATGSEPTEVFAFHGSDGGIDPYLLLAQAFDCAFHGLAAEPTISSPSLAMLVRRYTAAIRQRTPHGPYYLVGWSYGAFLAAEAAAALQKAGEAVQLVLLDPVSRADFDYAGRGGLLRLMSEGRTRVSLPDDFDELSEPAQLQVFLERAAAAGAWPGPADPVQAEPAIARIDHLLELLRTASRSVVTAPCLWLTAARRPAHWRPAAEEWRERLPLAERQEVDADHWQLVLDPTICTEVANRWRRWRQSAEIECSA